MGDFLKRKKLLYENLRMECEDKVMPIEVGCRGIIAPTTSSYLTRLGSQMEGHTSMSSSSGKRTKLSHHDKIALLPLSPSLPTTPTPTHPTHQHTPPHHHHRLVDYGDVSAAAGDVSGAAAPCVYVHNYIRLRSKPRHINNHASHGHQLARFAKYITSIIENWMNHFFTLIPMLV